MGRTSRAIYKYHLKSKHHAIRAHLLPARANLTCKANIICPIGRTSLAKQISLARWGKPRSKEKDSPKAVFFFCGAAGRTRTGTLLRAADFESATSANFVTAANCVYFIAFLRKICNNIRIGRLERRQICFPISK